jgi:hypothetical protein
MTAPGNLQRSSSKVDAIRRGQLKISKPIPIDDDAQLQLQDHDYDIAHTSPDDTQDTRPAPKSHSSLHHAISTEAPVSDSRTLHDQDDDLSRNSILPVPSPTANRKMPESTTTAIKRKRKSGLKNVFRKMFGKKDRQDLPNVDEEPRRGHSYHHSVRRLLCT